MWSEILRDNIAGVLYVIWQSLIGVSRRVHMNPLELTGDPIR